ncbi:ESX secretion-associated protein EspG [Nocardia sp. NPDC058633]|uniref:ESX secretion-associated protein EspG n=1 Tax=Nocardia sp. NPDC058633 TaxID=3346568 RepID=UPI003650E53B
MSWPQAPADDMTDRRSSWHLDPHAFAVGVEGHGRDRLPYPLTFRPEFAETHEIHRQRREAAFARLRQVYDDGLHKVLRALLEPEVRVEIEGLHGPGQSEVVRVYAGIIEGHAALAVQASGHTRDHGGDIALSIVPLADLAATIVAKLPRAQGGSTPRFECCRSDLDAATYARHPTRLSPVEQTQRFFRRPRTSTGEITVYPSFQVDSRPTTDGKAFLWLDYPNDGRYLIQHHDADNFTVIPGPPPELQHRLANHIAMFTNRRQG